MQIPAFIPPHGPIHFPEVKYALQDPEGLLAVGGDLSPQRLIHAYQQGIFPWFSDDQPILWWSPNPRLVLFPEQLHISRSLAKNIRNSSLRISLDENFPAVMRACSEPRPDQEGTWITDDMLAAYSQLHDMGVAHSVEAWDGKELVGGLYGIAIGKVFFGESMFSRQSNASKIAFTLFTQQLQQWGFQLIDCQVSSGHLLSLGAAEISREQFVQHLQEWCGTSVPWPQQATTL
jgi:leucyl/phenylalanyl-tRNA--protein transferase